VPCARRLTPLALAPRGGQRESAYHCYTAAGRVLEDKGWGLADEHIQFSLARQSFHLGRSAQALLYFVRLLSVTSRQSALQQTAYLRELVFIYKNFVPRRPDAALTEAVALETPQGTLRELPTAQSFLVPSPATEPLQVDAAGALWLTLGLPKLHRRSVRVVAAEAAEAAGAVAGDDAVWARLAASLEANDGMAGLVPDDVAVRKSGAARSLSAGSLNGRPVCVVGGTDRKERAATWPGPRTDGPTLPGLLQSRWR
jgi:hypothetical protein